VVLFFLLAFIAIPLIEIAVFIHIGDLIGLWWTLAVVVVTALGGTAMLRIQGIAVLYRAKAHLDKGKMPLREVFDGLCLLIAGALLLTPGFVTDIAGCLLFLQSIRTLLALIITRHLVAISNFKAQPFSTPQAYKSEEELNFSNIIDGEYEEVVPKSEANLSEEQDDTQN